jgi:hypothetical protein
VSDRRSLGFQALQGFAATHLLLLHVGLFLYARAWQVTGFHHLHARDCWLDFWEAGFPPSPCQTEEIVGWTSPASCKHDEEIDYIPAIIFI